jgi:MYXO-CTERM domain-containing protein
MRTSIRSAIAIAPALAITLVCGQAIATLTPPQPIALTGTDGPLGPNQGVGFFFGLLDGVPSINNNGQVAFRGLNNDVGTPQGMWIYSGGLNSNVALSGGAQPGGGTYPAGTSNINSTQINDASQWAFRLGASSGIFADPSGNNTNPTRVALAGDTAPGTGGATYSTSAVASGMPLINQAGQVGYIGNYTTNTGSPLVTISSPNNNSAGLYIGSAAAPTLVLRQAQPLADASVSAGGLSGVGLSPSDPNADATGNTRIGSFNAGSLAMNGNGQYAIECALQGTNVVTGTGVGSNSTAIVSNRGGSFNVLARAGMIAPDANGDSTTGNANGGTDLYRSISSSQIGFNNLGHVAFTSSLRNAGGTSTNTGALFTDVGGGPIRMIAKNGATMPNIYRYGDTSGVPLATFAGLNWGLQSGITVINSRDNLLWSSSYGASQSGYFTYDAAGTFRNVVSGGDVATGATSPTSGDTVKFSSLQGVPAMNGLGQIVFTSILNSTLGGVSGLNGNNSGLFAVDWDGSLMCIAQKGTLFHVGPGDDRTVSGFNFQSGIGGQDGHTVSLNDYGQFTFTLSFADGSSGVFVTNIPAPGAATLLGLGGLVALRRRRN